MLPIFGFGPHLRAIFPAKIGSDRFQSAKPPQFRRPTTFSAQ